MVKENFDKKLIRITTVPMALRYIMPGQLNFMQQHGFQVLMISADGKELQDAINNEKCRHIIVPMTRKITPFQDIRCLYSLIKIFKNEKPHIVHTMTPKAGLLGMVAAKFCGVPIRIHDVVGMPLMVENGFKYWVLKTIEKITYSSATQVWPNSFSLLDFIKNHSLTVENKLKLIAKGSSNGIKFSRFDPDILQPEILGLTRNIIRYDPGSIYLLSVGRLVKDKGLIELINVFGRLENKIPNLKLILLGSYENDLDPLPSNILSIIETNKNIVQVSWSDHVEYYMKLANLLVFPSHREGLPAVLMESGAMQLPVICSNIPGNTDVITDNKTGLLFECKSEEQLQEKIEFALTHPEKMKQMAIDLHEEIKLNFTQENIWNSILAQYRLLLSNV